MKILMLVDLYPPNIGGVEKYVQSLSIDLWRRGHQVSVITLGRPVSEVSEQGVKVYREEGIFQKIPFLYGKSQKKWHPPSADLVLTRRIAKIIEQEKPDIVHVHGWIIYSFLPLKKKFGVPLVVTLHGYGYFCSITNYFRNNTLCEDRSFFNCIQCAKKDYGYLRSLAAYCGINYNMKRLKLVDRYIAVSNFVKSAHVENLSLKDEDIVVVPNYYTQSENLESEGKGIQHQDFILFVGALAPYKGLDYLIQAYNRLKTSVKLLVIGYKYLNYDYKNSDNISVIENAPDTVIKEAFRNCRFAVFPSIWPEPLGTVVFEAMSYGKPVVATNTGGFPDMIINGETGFLVPANDIEALYQAMECLLDKPGLAREMGQRGYERWNTSFTAQVVIPQIEMIYRSLLKNNNLQSRQKT
jgi:glycosyltransferase involved in cell wall biosynthesis